MSTGTKLALVGLLALATVSFVLLQNYQLKNEEPNLRSVSDLKAKFEAFKKKFMIKFHNLEEELYRFSIFAKNYAYIQEQNEHDRSYVLGINEFIHLTPEEFQQSYLGWETTSNETATATVPGHQADGTPILSTSNLPDSVNWVERGAVTPVKQQGKCGACFAFSTTGGLESAYFQKTGELKSFSEQQILDCSKAEGNKGCRGGFPNNGFYYVQQHGIVTEEQYPYKAESEFKCQVQNADHKISKFYNVKVGDCDQLKAAVAQQPVSIGIDSRKLQFYSSGILTNCKTKLDHAVLIVGYAPEYWLIKNSWGPTYGEKGYVRIARGNTCGVCNAASYPIY